MLDALTFDAGSTLTPDYMLMLDSRDIAEFSISLATGRADIYTETPVKVSGFKRVIDEQDWTITKVTHFLNNSGFTTSLELEVRLSDVEYETEDDE
ncbi:TPA: hypothetical protein HIF66_001330 [Escherichia coli]|nr:hypothetical protein [Escherichia coli]